MKVWFLEGLFGPRKTLQRIRMGRYPFIVGRQEGISLVLDSPGISRQHACLEQDEQGRLLLRDMGSTNGTFLNRTQIEQPTEVHSGDIIHFAEEEFRAIADFKNTGLNLKMTQQGISDLPENLPRGGAQLHQLLLEARITAVFQPIVDPAGTSLHAYEMLGRGTHPELSESPAELFRIAESMGLEVQLSEMMRRVGLKLAQAADARGRFFINLHPREMENPIRLISDMRRVREQYPEMRLILELHEGAVADKAVLENLIEQMTRLDVQIAYDDFGVGQSRLVELADMPPAYVKIDRALIQDIHTATAARQDMVRLVVNYARERDILTIAEGVSGSLEAAFCAELGFDLMQGYHYGYPEPLMAANG